MALLARWLAALASVALLLCALNHQPKNPNLIIASWQSDTPLSSGIMHSALDAYLTSMSEKQWQEKRDAVMHRCDAMGG
jgi:hypothetical protein